MLRTDHWNFAVNSREGATRRSRRRRVFLDVPNASCIDTRAAPRPVRLCSAARSATTWSDKKDAWGWGVRGRLFYRLSRYRHPEEEQSYGPELMDETSPRLLNSIRRMSDNGEPSVPRHDSGATGKLPQCFCFVHPQASPHNTTSACRARRRPECDSMPRSNRVAHGFPNIRIIVDDQNARLAS